MQDPAMWRAFWTGLGLTRKSQRRRAACAQPAGLAAQDPEGTRRLLVWNRPQHLTDAEAEAWLRAQLEKFLGSDGLQRARLTRLTGASPGWPPPWDWMLELELRADAARAGGCDWDHWLADLRLLGLRPAAMVATEVGLIAAETTKPGDLVADSADGRCIEAPPSRALP